MKKILFVIMLALGWQAQGQGIWKEVPRLTIKSADGKDTLFDARNVTVLYSPDSSHASIQHQDHYRLVFSLPYHALKNDHLEAVWNIKGQSIYFHSNDTHDRFYSTDSGREELEFSSSDAVLDLKAKTLQVKRVPGVYTSNALIVPNNHEMTIANKHLPEFFDVPLILNSFTRYHHFRVASVSVLSRKEYKCKGLIEYDYHHPITDKEYLFENVVITTAKEVKNMEVRHITTIKVTIGEEDAFEIFHGKIFKGEATGVDSEPSLFFKGQVGRKEGANMVWEAFEGEISLTGN